MVFMVPNASPHIRFVFDWSEVDWQYLLATRCQDAGITKVHGLGKCGAVARMDLVIFFPNIYALLGSCSGKKWSSLSG